MKKKRVGDKWEEKGGEGTVEGGAGVGEEGQEKEVGSRGGGVEEVGSWRRRGHQEIQFPFVDFFSEREQRGSYDMCEVGAGCKVEQYFLSIDFIYERSDNLMGVRY